MQTSIFYRRWCGFAMATLFVLLPLGIDVQAQDEAVREREKQYVERREHEEHERREVRERSERERHRERDRNREGDRER